jgi:hypothetical protein
MQKMFWECKPYKGFPWKISKNFIKKRVLDWVHQIKNVPTIEGCHLWQKDHKSILLFDFPFNVKSFLEC